MTLRQAAFLRQCFPSAGRSSDYILKEYGTDRFLEQVRQGNLPLFLTEGDRRHIRRASAGQADAMLKSAGELGQQVIDFSDPRYPELLRQIPGSPILLFCRGNLALMQKLCICAVGSRSVSDYGMLAAASLAYQLADAGVCVVSGLARGCDSAAHRGALMAGGATIAVCGCSLEVSYPAGSEKLREEIAEKGLMISEYPPGTPVRASSFPVRNRILAGLSRGVLVTEAAQASGAMITARAAADMGRDVFTVPNSIFDPSARGSIELMKQGAKPVADGGDILEEYRLLPVYDSLRPERAELPAPIRFDQVASLRDEQLPPPKSHGAPVRHRKAEHPSEKKPARQPEKKAPADLSALSETARSCYLQLSDVPIALPELEVILEEKVSALLEAVTELELAGLIRSLPGRRYIKL